MQELVLLFIPSGVQYHIILWDGRAGATMKTNSKKINGNGLKFKQPYIYLFKCNSLDLLRFCIKYFFFKKPTYTQKDRIADNIPQQWIHQLLINISYQS